MNNNKGILAAVVIVVLIILGSVLFKGGDKTSNGSNNTNTGSTETVSAEPRAGEIAVSGKLACEPLKSGATPTAEECVLGLQGTDGKFYALDTSKLEQTEKGISPESSVKAIGTFTASNPSSDETGIYKYDGVLVVRVMSISK